MSLKIIRSSPISNFEELAVILGINDSKKSEFLKKINSGQNIIKLDFDVFFKSMFKFSQPIDLLKQKNQEFLFYSLFSDFLFSKNQVELFYDKTKNILFLKGNLSNPRKSPQDLVSKGASLIFRSLCTHTNSAFYTSSKNKVFYNNSHYLDNLTYEDFFEKENNYMIVSNAAILPFVKPFAANIGNTNILDYLVDPENKNTVFVNEFVKLFGYSFYKDVCVEFDNFIKGQYNETKVTGVEKQILIPDSEQNESYISISPMFNHNIGFKLNDLKFQKNKLFSTTDKEVGGTNSQNISYSAPFFGGILTSLDMSFPKKDLDEINILLYNVNNKGIIKTYINNQLYYLNKLNNNEDVTNENKRKYKKDVIFDIVSEFQKNILCLSNNIDSIEDSDFREFLLGEMNKSEESNFLSQIFNNCIFPKSQRKYLSIEIKTECIEKLLNF